MFYIATNENRYTTLDHSIEIVSSDIVVVQKKYDFINNMCIINMVISVISMFMVL